MGAAFLSVVWKAWLLSRDAFPFNSDEAVVGLMARHILAGSRPVFFYGQAYLGSLDAFLVAGAFQIFGESVLSIRLVQIALYAGTVVTTVLLAGRFLRPGWPQVAAGILMAFPPVLLTLYSTVSLGGYGEALLFGNLLLLLAWDAREVGASLGRLLVWGVVAGLGFWTFPLTLVYVFPAAGLMLPEWRRQSANLRTRLAVAGALGILIGAAPWWVTALQGNLLPQMAELGGSAISGASRGGFFEALLQHMLNLALFAPTVVFGLRPPWSVTALVPLLSPVLLAFWIWVLYRTLAPGVPREMAEWARRMLLGLAAILALAFVLTPFGADPSGRYFLPLLVPLSLFAAAAMGRLRQTTPAWVAPGMLLAVVGFHVLATLEVAGRPPRITTQFDSATWLDHSWDRSLISFLAGHGESRGYSNYWVAYPIAFLSNEEVILVPRLPYHPDLRYTPRDDRYPPYTQTVAQSARAAYVLGKDPRLEQLLREGLRQLQVTWHEQRIGDYLVFFGLSRKVEPAELGLGVER